MNTTSFLSLTLPQKRSYPLHSFWLCAHAALWRVLPATVAVLATAGCGYGLTGAGRCCILLRISKGTKCFKDLVKTFLPFSFVPTSTFAALVSSCQ